MNIILFAFSLSQANAQNADTPPPARVIYKDVTEVDFGTELDVNGQIISPNGSVVSEPIRPNFNPLLSLRYDFQEELNQSVNLIK